MFTETQEKIWNCLGEMDGEEALRLIIDWYGLQLLDDEFLRFLEDEGVL